MYTGVKQGLIIYYDHKQLPNDAWNKSLPRPEVAPLLVKIHFFREEKAFEATFVFDENLVEEDAPRHKLYMGHSRNYYARAKGGVYLSDICHRGISSTVEHMERHGTLNSYFNRLAPPPQPRWSDLKLHEVPIPEAAEAYRLKLEELYNASPVFLKRYEADSFADFEACCRVQALYPWTTFQTELLRHPIFLSLPVLNEPNFNLVADGEWFVGGGFYIEAFLASVLRSGGPYAQADARTALTTAQAARESIWGESYDGLWLYYLYRPWSKWFYDVAWDVTMIVVERSEERNSATITCLFATSTD